MPESITVTEVVNQVIISDPYVVTGGGGGGGVTDHGALTGLADDDHTQYLIGNVGTSTTRNSITMGVGGRGLNIDAVDSVDTHIRLTLSGVQFATWNNESGIVIEPGAGGIQADSLQVLASNTGRATVNIPHGTAPTTPVNGDIWTTTGGVFARVNGSTVGPIGVPPGSSNQIVYNGGGVFGASSNFTYDQASSGGLRLDNGHLLIGGVRPSNHSVAGFYSIYFAGNQAAAFCPDTAAGFESLTMSSNRVRGASGWVAQSTGTIWSMTIGHGSSVNAFSIDHATSTASGSAPGSNYQNVFVIDGNRRASFGQQAFGTFTSPISAKLSVVNATSTDVVLVARAASGQSANIFETRDSSNNALTTIATTGAITVRQNSGTIRIQTDGNGIGFFGVTPVARPNVTGSRGGNAALASLLTSLANLGLITDSTTA